jgi:hypothetical protein
MSTHVSMTETAPGNESDGAVARRARRPARTGAEFLASPHLTSPRPALNLSEP